MLLEGKVALVTGGARGIGAAIVRVLAREGAAVAINYAHSGEQAKALAQRIVQGGGKALPYAADVRDAEAVRHMIAQIRDDFGRLDAVVNNAIAGRQHGALTEASDEDFRTAFDFGCMAIIHMIRAVRPVMREQGGGRIINIVTELWNLAPEEWSVYMAGKGAMVGISRSLARELGPDNITVNMVAPGWMADEKVDTESEGSKNFARSLPLRRHGSAEEIGNACAFLMSDLASYITGAYIPVTGGRVTQVGL
ncbi:3-oxoacyl-(acyl-carrier-protein) reductase [Chthonomonas calidirosea]|uniref:SDR family NAD(P)-dependent oxidoreductase n=1 Tax=Chthonomonas calidirosea TaxID=454171 RepID=UPI0006DD4070|nr:SDR family oxidoreductase [Chthonomonas calidirosea]CEK14067.1 3-oxoacyl-(acyl-carrier-protein) reductase [Chthonomonas calidirosea]